MHLFSVQNLSVLAFVLPVFTTPSAAQDVSSPQPGTTLLPISIVDYEASMGLQRRDSNDLSALDPQSQSQLVYGSAGNNGKVILANMTLYAPEGLPIVLLERFEELNVSVKCHDREGKLSLTFSSKDAFDYAVKQWGYVNKADDGKFLFITNKDGCGPDDQRQAYTVSNVTDDTATLTTSLAAQVVALSDIAGSYDLDLGHAVPLSQARRIKRGLLGDIDQDGEEISNSTSGNLDNDIGSFSVDISAGQQGQRRSIYNDPSAGFALDCTNCFTAGSFTVQGHISVQDFTLQDLTLTASPNSVFAALELEAIITATGNPQPITYNQTLFSEAIPGAGYKIHDFLTIGASLTYSISGSCAFSGSANIALGANASVPDSAEIVVDYENHGASSATGFDSIQVTPVFHINNELASMNLSAISQPAITFGVDLKKVGSTGVTISLNLPELSATLSAERDEDSACSNDTEASKTGIEIVSEAGIEVGLGFGATLGADGKYLDYSTGPWSLFKTSTPLPSKCFPLDIPGLEPSPNATNPSLSTLQTMSTTMSGMLAFPTPNLGPGGSLLPSSSSLPSLSTNSSARSGSQAIPTSTGEIFGSGTSSSPGATSIKSSSTEASSSQEMASESTPTTSHPSSPTNLSSSLPSTASMDLGEESTSTHATSSIASSLESTSVASTSTGPRMTSSSVPTTSSVPSSTKSSSTLLTTSSTSAKTTLITTPATSRPSSNASTDTGKESISTHSISLQSSRVEASTLSSLTRRSSSATSSSTLTISSTSSSIKPPSTLLSTASSSIKTVSATKSASSNAEFPSTTSSPTLERSSTASSSALPSSSRFLETKPSSTLLPVSSSSLETTLATTSASSMVHESTVLSSSSTTTKSRITSSPTMSATTSRSESSSTHPLPTTLNSKTTSKPPPATSQESSQSESASTLHPTTRSSTTESMSTSESSHSTEVDTTTQSPSLSRSNSASLELSHTASFTSTPASRSSLPKSSSQTAEHTTKVTTTTATTSSTSLSHPVDTETSPPSHVSTTVANQSPKMPTSTKLTPSTSAILPVTSSHSAANEAKATPTVVKESPTKSPNVPTPKHTPAPEHHTGSGKPPSR